MYRFVTLLVMLFVFNSSCIASFPEELPRKNWTSQNLAQYEKALTREGSSLFFKEVVQRLLDARNKNSHFCLNACGIKTDSTISFTLDEKAFNGLLDTIKTDDVRTHYLKVAFTALLIEECILWHTASAKTTELPSSIKDEKPDDIMSSAQKLLITYMSPLIKRAVGLTNQDINSEAFINRANMIEELIDSSQMRSPQDYLKDEHMAPLKITRAKLVMDFIRTYWAKKNEIVPLSDFWSLAEPRKNMLRKPSKEQKDVPALSLTLVLLFEKLNALKTNFAHSILGESENTGVKCYLGKVKLVFSHLPSAEQFGECVSSLKEQDFFIKQTPYIQDLVFAIFIEELISGYYNKQPKRFSANDIEERDNLEQDGALEAMFRLAARKKFCELIGVEEKILGDDPCTHLILSAVDVDGDHKDTALKYRTVRDRVIAAYLSELVDTQGNGFEIDATDVSVQKKGPIVVKLGKKQPDTPIRDRLRKKAAAKNKQKKKKEPVKPNKPLQKDDPSLSRLIDVEFKLEETRDKLSKAEKELATLKRQLSKRNDQLSKANNREENLNTQLKKAHDLAEEKAKLVREQNDTEQLISNLKSRIYDLEAELYRKTCLVKEMSTAAIKVDDDLKAEVDTLKVKLEEQACLSKESQDENKELTEKLKNTEKEFLSRGRTIERIASQNSEYLKRIKETEETNKRLETELAEAQSLKKAQTQQDTIQLQNQLDQASTVNQTLEQQQQQAASDLYELQYQLHQASAYIQYLEQLQQQTASDLYELQNDPYLIKGTFVVEGRHLTLEEMAHYATIAVAAENSDTQAADIKDPLKEEN